MQNMADQTIMENLLLTTKGACDLYLHGVIEASTQAVHAAMDDALSDSLTMQRDIYSAMEKKGWYPMQQADAQQLRQVQQKFADVH